MSSKIQSRLDDCIKRKKKIAKENQRLVRALAALMHEFGSLTVSYQSACKVSDDDQVNIEFNKQRGTYTISLLSAPVEEDESANRMGSGSDEVGLPNREGDVGGPVPPTETEPSAVEHAVQPVDQQREGED